MISNLWQRITGITRQTASHEAATASQERLLQALAALPDRNRAVYLLSARDGLSHEEIGRRLGLSPTDVEERLACALAAIDRAIGTDPARDDVAPTPDDG